MPHVRRPAPAATQVGLPPTIREAVSSRARLARATEGVHAPVTALAPPGLRVAGLDETVAAPITRAQATALGLGGASEGVAPVGAQGSAPVGVLGAAPVEAQGVAPVVAHDVALVEALGTAPVKALGAAPVHTQPPTPGEAEGASAVEIAATRLSFANPAWPAALAKVVSQAARGLGVEPSNVRADITKLVVVGPGGVGSVEAVSGFATLVLQPPARFSGGEVVREGRVWDFGAADGSCEFVTYFSCALAGAAAEVAPVRSGCRLLIVYGLAWIGAREAPSVSAGGGGEVKKALEQFVGGFGTGAWTIGFALGERYFPGEDCSNSLAGRGVSGLLGKDKEVVEGLLAAAESGAVGEVKFAICELERIDTHYMDEEGEVVDQDMGDIAVKETYDAAGGRLPLPSLDFLDWSFAANGGMHWHMEDGGMFGEESSEPRYSSTAFVMWPAQKELHLRLRSGEMVEDIFKSFSVDRALQAVETVVAGLEAEEARRGQWANLKFVWQFCLREKLQALVCRCLKLVALLRVEVDGADSLIAQSVNVFGWPGLAQEVEAYVCPPNPADVYSIEDRISAVVCLSASLPTDTRMNAVGKIVEALDASKGLIVARQNIDAGHLWSHSSHGNSPFKPAHDKSWTSLCTLLSCCVDTRGEAVVLRLCSAVGKLNESNLERVGDVVSSARSSIGIGNEPLVKLSKAIQTALLESKLAQFDGLVKSLCSNRYGGTKEFGKLFNTIRSCAGDEVKNSGFEASLVFLLSKLDTFDEAKQSFVIKAADEVMLSIKESRHSNPLRADRERRAVANILLPVLKKNVDALRLKMPTEPPRRQLSFPNLCSRSSKFADLDSFLVDQRTHMEMIAHRKGIAAARKLSFQIRKKCRLVTVRAIGTGSRARVHVEKSLGMQEGAFRDYERKNIALENAVKMLAKVQAIIAPPVPRVTSANIEPEPPAKRLKVDVSEAAGVNPSNQGVNLSVPPRRAQVLVSGLAASVEKPVAAGSDRGSVLPSKLDTPFTPELIAKPSVVGCNAGPTDEVIGFQ